MTYDIEIISDPHGNVHCEVANGPAAGMKIDETPILKGQSFDKWAVESIERAEECVASAKRHIEKLRQIIGNASFPTREEFLAARAAAEREYEEKPLREAEAALDRLIAADADIDKITYARINVAVCRHNLENSDTYLPDGRWINFEPMDYISDQETGGGVPVRAEIEGIGADEQGSIFANFSILAPFKFSLNAQPVPLEMLARICRAAGHGPIENLEEIMFMPFVALMNDDADFTRFCFPDEGNVPDVHEYEPHPRPWGTVIGRLADREAMAKAA